MDVVLDLVSEKEKKECKRLLSYLKYEKELSGFSYNINSEEVNFYLYNTKAFQKNKMDACDIKRYENNEIEKVSLEDLFWQLRERGNVLKRNIDNEIYKDPINDINDISLYAINRILANCDNDINELYKLEYKSILDGSCETQMYKIDRIEDYRKRFEGVLL